MSGFSDAGTLRAALRSFTSTQREEETEAQQASGLEVSREQGPVRWCGAVCSPGVQLRKAEAVSLSRCPGGPASHPLAPAHTISLRPRKGRSSPQTSQAGREGSRSPTVAWPCVTSLLGALVSPSECDSHRKSESGPPLTGWGLEHITSLFLASEFSAYKQEATDGCDRGC